jgi:hypothetical protein
MRNLTILDWDGPSKLRAYNPPSIRGGGVLKSKLFQYVDYQYIIMSCQPYVQDFSWNF